MKNHFEIRGEEVYISLPHNHLTIVDLDDLPKLLEHGGTWSIARSTKDSAYWYVSNRKYINGKYVTFYLHRFITDAPKGYDVDHLNHNAMDNRRSNLKVCTQAENIQNRALAKNNTSGVVGVNWDSYYNKWHCRVKVNKQIVFDKQFKEYQDAVDAITAFRKGA